MGNGAANFKQFLLYQQLNNNIKKYKLYSRTDVKDLIKYEDCQVILKQ